MLGYWPYATHKKTIFLIYMYICHIASKKPSILNKRLIFFLQHKKNSSLKINMPENKYLSLSFIFFQKNKKKVSPAGSLAQASDPAGHKRAQFKV